MKNNQVKELTIEKLIPGGEALGRWEGKVVFVPGALPGERVRGQVVKETPGWTRLGPPEILEASPDRVEPFCPLYDVCGGCSWQHMSYPAQLKAKEALVQEALKRQGGIEDSPVKVIPSPPRNYRQRIRVKRLPGGGAGFRRKGSSQVVEVPACPVGSQGINRFLAAAAELPPLSPEFQVFAQGEEFWVEGRDKEARADLAGKTFIFPPELFFQSNLSPLPELLDFGLKGETGRRALDLYGGAGLFGAFLAPGFEQVLGVEREPAASSYWMKNIGPQGQFFSMNLEEWITTSAARGKVDFVVVDPPRGGLSPGVRRWMLKKNIKKILYVSCDPVTQARDLKEFLAQGYRLEKRALADLYPQTPHVETVVRLVKE